MEIGNNNFTKSVTGGKDSQSSPKLKKRKSKEVSNAGVLDLVRSIVNPEYSLDDLDNLLIDAEYLRDKVPIEHRKAALNILKKAYPGFPSVTMETRRNILNMSFKIKPASLNPIGLLQLAAIEHALDWYEDMRLIVPHSKLEQERFCEHFYRCSWWTAVWQDLVRAHGDRVNPFFLFD